MQPVGCRMQGLMQEWPLLLHKILDHAAIQHGRREVVTRSIEGPIHRTDYAAIKLQRQTADHESSAALDIETLDAKKCLNQARRCSSCIGAGIGAGRNVSTLDWLQARPILLFAPQLREPIDGIARQF